VLDAQVTELVLASRVRRRLAAQKLNWVSALAPFDVDGDGALSPDAMRDALVTLGLCLSEAEAMSLVKSLLGSGAKVHLSAFEAKLVAAFASPEVQELEAWARHLLEPFSSRVAIFLRERDGDETGVLPVAGFRAALQELLAEVSVEQLDVLVLLAGKDRQGRIDHMNFADAFGAPPPPPPLPNTHLPEIPAPPPAPPDG